MLIVGSHFAPLVILARLLLSFIGTCPLFSGRLLTLEARVSRENAGNSEGRATRRCTTQTDAAARSFILPDDVSNEVKNCFSFR